MAAALMEYGRLHGIKPIPENVEDFQNFPGEGVYGEIDGKGVYIGNRKICVRAGCENGTNNTVFQASSFIYDRSSYHEYIFM